MNPLNDWCETTECTKPNLLKHAQECLARIQQRQAEEMRSLEQTFSVMIGQDIPTPERSDPDMHSFRRSRLNPNPMTLERGILALEVYDIVFKAFESFREQNIGADLAYLMGAILDGPGSYVDWSNDYDDGETPPLLPLLREHFPEKHEVWHYIQLSGS